MKWDRHLSVFIFIEHFLEIIKIGQDNHWRISPMVILFFMPGNCLFGAAVCVGVKRKAAAVIVADTIHICIRIVLCVIVSDAIHIDIGIMTAVIMRDTVHIEIRKNRCL